MNQVPNWEGTDESRATNRIPHRIGMIEKPGESTGVSATETGQQVISSFPNFSNLWSRSAASFTTPDVGEGILIREQETENQKHLTVLLPQDNPHVASSLRRASCSSPSEMLQNDWTGSSGPEHGRRGCPTVPDRQLRGKV